MSRDNFDGQEIDLLVRELETKRFVSPPSAQPVEQRRPGSRWSTGDLIMPSARPSRGRAFAFRPTLRLPFQLPSLPFDLPRLPDVTTLFSMPRPETLVRLWVGLGAIHCASMTFWPYPKTYFWGLVLYLVSLALVFVTGVWGARLSWDARLGAAHTVSLGTVVWAVMLVVTALPPV